VPQRSSRTLLIRLVVACLLPGVLGAVALFYYEYQRGQSQIEADAIQTTRALVQAVDSQLLRAQAAAQALTTSKYLAERDFRGFHRQATTLLEKIGIGTYIALHDEAGRNIVNTLRPFGETLPRHPNPDQIRKVFLTGTALISDFYVGAISNSPRISVYAPVVEAGKVVYAINIGIDSSQLGNILISQRLPSDWLVSIVDNTGTIAARNRTPERFVGTKAPPDIFQRFTDAPEGSMESWTKEGIPALVVFSRSPETGWRVVSAIPRASLEAPLLRSLALLGLGLTILFAIGITLAWYMGNRIADSVRALSQSAFRLGTGENAPAPKVEIKEAAEAANAIEEAAALLKSQNATLQKINQSLVEKDSELAKAQRIARFGTWTWNYQTGDITSSESVPEMFGREITNFHDAKETILPLESWEKVNTAAMKIIHTGGYDLELQVIHANGTTLWINAKGEVSEVRGNEVITLRGTVQDITDRKRFELALFEQKERAQVTLQSIADGVITTNREGTIDYLNPVAEELTGWKLNAAIGQPLTRVLNLVSEQSGQVLPNPIERALADGQAHRLSDCCLLIRPDGSRSAIEDSAAPIRDRDGRVIGAVLVFHDVTESREITAKIAHQATHDALTGLPNRVLAWDRLEHAIAVAKRDDSCVGVLFLDLDRFKNINDSLGHAYGDDLLKQVAVRLTSSTRAADTVSRQGGDEFMVIIPKSNRRALFADVAEKILCAVDAPYFIDGHELRVTFSIGISVFPHDGLNAHVLIKNADAAMYAAKANGRNNFQFYSPDMNKRAIARLSLEAELRHALERKEFEVYYQPKISAMTAGLIGAEALIRWNHPAKGMVPPGQFIEIAEESGLIKPIGQWILEEVCRQNREWLEKGLSCVPIAVNLSAIQFRDKSLVNTLKRILEDTDLPPELLELELTESSLMQDSASVVDALKKLKEIGTRLSIDDFGTGYSSLSYLKRFPIDTLKIDRAFVRDVPYDRDGSAIVEAIISMGHSLHLSVIAEGVETADQLNFLKARRCNEIQGNYYSEPVRAPKFEQMLADPHHYSNKATA
jgi:diguanylate cyclase (GGDEF)-like protein/PAS domain S-box-containing protein